MEQITSRIIKSNQINIEGRMRLDMVSAPIQLQKGSENALGSGSGAQVRIIDSQSNFAVIEITCRCGEKIFLKCQYVQS